MTSILINRLDIAMRCRMLYSRACFMAGTFGIAAMRLKIV